MDSEEMIKMLKAKDLEAISSLYDNYAPALYGLILRVVKSQGQAEEILGQAFLKILTEIDSYQKTTTFFTWMCSIARSLARKHIPLNIIPKITIDDELQANNFTPKYDDKLIEGMDSESKVVWDHIFLQGHSLLETSKLLTIPLERVKIQFKFACDYINNNLHHGKKVFLSSAVFVLSLIQL